MLATELKPEDPDPPPPPPVQIPELLPEPPPLPKKIDDAVSEFDLLEVCPVEPEPPPPPEPPCLFDPPPPFKTIDPKVVFWPLLLSPEGNTADDPPIVYPWPPWPMTTGVMELSVRFVDDNNSPAPPPPP